MGKKQKKILKRGIRKASEEKVAGENRQKKKFDKE